ncbi:MAG: sigma-70 family RNA polymerase sigma factor [Planctomycetota bacterium]
MKDRNDSEITPRSESQLDISVWYRRVYALCQAKLISQSDAEDAAQETFVRGIARLDELRSQNAMGGWLRGIARNVCVDLIRRNKVRQTSGEPIETLAAKANNSTNESKQLNAYIGQLPDPLREVVLLHYYEEMTYDQMAEWLDVARSTVSERLSKARRILKQKMIADRSMP